MKTHSKIRFFTPPGSSLFWALAAASVSVAQSVTPESPLPVAREESIILSPFEVTASTDMGYEATETLAGSRVNTPLKDVATQINVMTREFLEDLAITNLDDAMQYSLNTETRFESIDVTDNAIGQADSLFVVGSGQGGRTRGLSAPNNSHDFFDTFVRMDSYNTERFTFASGPNSILFGNSSPAGTIDTTFKRAQTRRSGLEISNRMNASTSSRRFSFDYNQPVIAGKLAVRIAALTDHDNSWRKPGFYAQDRFYATLTCTPIKRVTFRAYSENGDFNQQPVKNTLVQDHVTPWINAGRPLYDNGLGKTLPSATTNPPINPSLRKPNAVVRPIISYDANGFLGFPITGQANMALTVGPVDTTPAPNNFERSILDQSIYPYDRNFNGELSQSKYRSWVRGGMVEINPFKTLFIEAAFNEEKMRSRGIEFMDGRVHELNADPNMYLNDRVTPNPMVGRFYVEDAIAGVNNAAVKGYGHKKQRRVSLSYELNFEDRTNWQKWLGSHRFAFLLDNLQSKLVREQSLLLSTPNFNPPVPGTYSFVTTDLNSQRPGFRYYINPEKGDWTVKLPFDPMQDGVITQPGWVDANGKQVYLGSFDPSVPANAPSAARNRVDSAAFVTQSYLLNRRLVFSYGRRRDAVDIFGDPSLQANWNFDRFVDTVNWETLRSEVPINTVKSIVVHPASWISLSYSESTTQQVRTEVVRNLDGSIADTGSGTGKDYGLTLRWRNWLSVRLNKYENVGVGNASALRNATPTATENNLGPQIKQTVAALERGFQTGAPDFNAARPQTVPPSTLSQRFAYYQEDLAKLTQPYDAIGSVMSNRYEVLSDSLAKGYELTLIGNPTPNWRISVTGAKNTAMESNIGGQFWDFIKERLPLWGAPENLDRYLPQTTASGNTNNYRTFRQVLAVAAQNWNYIRLSEGRLNNNIRKYRFTATTRYGFQQGALKGSFIGASYAWRSAAAVGYPITTITDNPFLLPGIAGSALNVSDLNRPYFGGALTNLDAFLGYNRRLGGKTNWRIQINVRNVLNKNDPIVQRVLTTGEGAIYTVQDPRAIIITNTFSF